MLRMQGARLRRPSQRVEVSQGLLTVADPCPNQTPEEGNKRMASWGSMTQLVTRKVGQKVPKNGGSFAHGFANWTQALVVPVEVPCEQSSKELRARSADASAPFGARGSGVSRARDEKRMSQRGLLARARVRTQVDSHSSFTSPVATGMIKPKVSSSVPRAQALPQEEI